LTPGADGALALDNLPVGLIEGILNNNFLIIHIFTNLTCFFFKKNIGTFSLKSHTESDVVVDQHTFRHDQKNAVNIDNSIVFFFQN
jgi:hypothetical protein